ncbi:PHD finger protein ALFIN-LIKE 8-like [Centruroides sculpturatus]|uniref:PHD finger protein ALFIN-LIKE 8-like n=1 Tax=Centruroides sculpturatus TaxID=218467 RepID=UPI000C6ED124|nr:PHD finger protein ALFIN-LIKE 8-like [Centruroides sculpturatus]
MDKLKEKDKKKEPKASKQQKKPNIQRAPVKKLNLDRPSRPKPSRDDSSVSSDESFHSDVSSVMDFVPSTKEPENEDAECIFCNGKFCEDERVKIWVQCFICSLWAHLDFTGAERESYNCDFCK